MIPGEARATVDARILPGDSVASVLEHVRRAIDDPAIEVRILTAAEPRPIASTETPGFAALAATAQQIFPDAVVAPGLLVAGTDSRHYVPLADDVDRFRPFRMTRDDLARFHGVNERIGGNHYERVIAFYARLLRGLEGPRAPWRPPAVAERLFGWAASKGPPSPLGGSSRPGGAVALLDNPTDS